jgi:hypothetical protein
MNITQRQKAERWDSLLRALSNPAIHDTYIHHLSTMRRAALFILATARSSRRPWLRNWRELNDRRHAALRAEFEQTCLRRRDDELAWLVEYISDEITYHDSKTFKYPNNYRYLLRAREVVGLELVRRGLAADGSEQQVA